MITRRSALLGSLPLAAPWPVRAQGISAAWPRRPVRVIVPFPPGTTPDLSTRPVAAHLARVYGQPFVVENRSGAAGTVGVAAIAAATDGHTIGMANTGTIATAKAFFPNLPYDPERDLRPIAMLTVTPLVLAVGPSAEAQDVAGFIARAKAAPGRMSYASVGVSSTGHLAMEELKLTQGLDLVHVPYRGFPEAVIDLVTGRVEAMFCPAASVITQHRAGQARVLAAAAEARLPQLPEIPTMAESGVPNSVALGWNGLFAPTSVPDAELPRLNAEACRALADPATRDNLVSAGFVLDCTPIDQFTAFVAAETRRWGGLVRRLGLRAEA